MDDSDSDSSVERLLNKNYSFLRNSFITKDGISNNSTTSQAAPENGVESQIEQQKVTDTKPTDKMNEFNSSRYDNLTLEELNNIAERIKIYHEAGIVPCQNKYKRKNSKKTQKMQKNIRKRKTTFGQGRIGTTCSTFGVKQCMCCNIDKENCSTVGEQNGWSITGNNCNSSPDRTPINELTLCQLETSRSNEVQELDRLSCTENEQPSTFQSCKRKRPRTQSPIRPVTNSEPTMSQLINLRGRTVQKSVENHKSPLRGNERNGLVTSTPLNIHHPRHSNPINSCNNPFEVSVIEIDNTESDVECCFIEESQSTCEIVQNNGNNDAENEEEIMDYVNDLLGTTAYTIAEEVEERYQRLDESRRAVSDAISNAISSNHDAVHEEMDLEHSVILVGVSSPQPILVEDSISQINEPNDITHNVDIDIVEEIVTSTGARTRNKGMASCSNVRQTCQNVEVDESTDEPKKQPSGSSTALRECSICLESLAKREISATTCGHVFCTECIKAAIRTSRMCPNCRTRLTLKKIHPLYL